MSADAGRRWNPPPPRADPPSVNLTPRQADVLALLCCGLTNGEIGARLYITEDTVKTTVKNLYRRLGARNRAHALTLACTGQVAVYVTDRRAA